MMFRLLALVILPLLGAAGLLGDSVGSSTDVLSLTLLSVAAVSIDCLTKRGKRCSLLPFLLICLLLYSAQLSVLLYPRLARATTDSGSPQFAVKLSVGTAPVRDGRSFERTEPTTSSSGGAAGQVALPPAPVLPSRTEARTISLVLPCAEERDNALNTVQRFCERTPDDTLVEIIVVDDGSKPPMQEVFSKDHRRLDQNPRCKLKILRHQLTTGLMAAKLTGGKEAIGDVIAFFDCHCSPNVGWHKEILEKIRENPRAMVVPAITDLDLDTFDEKVGSAVNAKCYLTFDADFKWFDDESDFIPTISGGLVAMGREWFNLTGGFDEEMHGWGGENLDQSLRAWLCGGAIVRAKSSRVAHMWRTGDPRTRSRYRLKARGTDNRGRVAAAWFDAFLPVYRGSKLPPSAVKNYDVVKQRLGCKPFSYFLYRFRKVYISGGVIAKEVFHLRDAASKLCLTRAGFTRATDCQEGHPGQQFQLGNVDRKGGRCCSGIRAYGSNDCMDWFDKSGGHYYPCDVTGQNTNQQHRLRADGRIQRGEQECLILEGKEVKKKACARLRSDQGVFEKVYVFTPLEWKLYQQEIAKHRFAEELPDLPDN